MVEAGGRENMGVRGRRGRRRAVGKGRMRDGVEGEGERGVKRDKESGNQRERGCYAFPQHSFPPVQRAVKRQ